MKIILTGATGFIGGTVLAELVRDPAISSVLVLTRRDLPKEKCREVAEAGDINKVKIEIVSDFLNYSDTTLSHLAGAEAVIWCLGRPFYKEDVKEYERTNRGFALYGAKTFANVIAPKLPNGKPFRFVFLNGQFAEHDQTKSLWIMTTTRKVKVSSGKEKMKCLLIEKGAIEAGINELADKSANFQAFTGRPGGVLEANPNFMTRTISHVFSVIKVDKLAKALIDLAKNGSEKDLLSNVKLNALADRFEWSSAVIAVQSEVN